VPGSWFSGSAFRVQGSSFGSAFRFKNPEPGTLNPEPVEYILDSRPAMFLTAPLRRAAITAAAVGLLTTAGRPAAQSTPPGVEAARFARIDELVRDAIAQHQLPGAVVLVGRGEAVLYSHAIGQRAL